jgi:hypothetical protein
MPVGLSGTIRDQDVLLLEDGGYPANPFRNDPGRKRSCRPGNHWLMCTTFAGGNPLKEVDEAMEYAPIFSE